VPIYEYKCQKGHTFEVMQRMSDDPLEECTICGASVQRVFHPVAVHFKGSGFYNTDYGKQKGKKAESNSSDSSSADSKPSTEKPASSSDGAKSDKKASTKAST